MSLEMILDKILNDLIEFDEKNELKIVEYGDNLQDTLHDILKKEDAITLMNILSDFIKDRLFEGVIILRILNTTSNCTSLYRNILKYLYSIVYKQIETLKEKISNGEGEFYLQSIDPVNCAALLSFVLLNEELFSVELVNWCREFYLDEYEKVKEEKENHPSLKYPASEE